MHGNIRKLISGYGQKNNSAGGRFRVKRGIQDIREVGKVIEYEGQKQLSVYDGDECNKFRGTDSTIFGPFLTPSDKIEAFAPDLCRYNCVKGKMRVQRRRNVRSGTVGLQGCRLGLFGCRTVDCESVGMNVRSAAMALQT